MPLGLFAGRCRRATRKKSRKIFKETATASSYAEAAEAAEAAEKTRCQKQKAKGRGPKGRGKSLKLARFGVLRASVPKSEQQDTSTSNSPPLTQLGDKHTHSFRSQMAKVELVEAVWKVVLGG